MKLLDTYIDKSWFRCTYTESLDGKSSLELYSYIEVQLLNMYIDRSGLGVRMKNRLSASQAWCCAGMFELYRNAHVQLLDMYINRSGLVVRIQNRFIASQAWCSTAMFSCTWFLDTEIPRIIDPSATIY